VYLCEDIPLLAADAEAVGPSLLKAISAARQSPALLRELKKDLSASKEKRAVAVRKASGPVKAPTRQEDSNRMASQSGLDSYTEPASR
jgi:hypothetical protein